MGAAMLSAMARAHPLNDHEHLHLFRLAGRTEPGPGTTKRYVTPSLPRLLARLPNVPVMIVDESLRSTQATPNACNSYDCQAPDCRSA